MKVLHRRCAGLDVHSKTVVAGVRVAKGRQVHQDVQSFDTTTRGLLELAAWLTQHGVTHVAMEATGQYWKPVWHVLEGEFELVLANAMHVKNVPGRKSDVSDAGWLADLLAHGLVRGSFVPPEPIQELRDLTRTRKQLVRQQVRHVQRVQKTLEDANLKLTQAVSNVMGVSGRRMLEAIVAGETDPRRLAELAHPRLQTPRERLIDALTGCVKEHHRFLLRLHLDQFDALQQAIARVEERLGETLEPFRASEDLLITIPGVDKLTAQVILAEIGVDMSRFPTAGHLISWAGLCPRMDETAGKRRSTRLRKGAPWLKTALVQSAWAAVKRKDGYLCAQYHRLRGRRGSKKAIMGVAASMLTAIYFMLQRQVPYLDLGASYYERRDRDQIARRLVRRIKDLGYDVELKDVA